MPLVVKVGVNGEVKEVQEDLPIIELPVSIPSIVTRRQARRALLQAGLLGQVDIAIDAIPDEETRSAMRIDWEDATEFKRDDETLIALAAALDLTAEQLDALFIQASQF